ncbi:hypothetical protein BX666DRAFT_1988714 [Dichotomocladium elegans]|nr:hypothetical protein BX666DRAFT_1988714 [Dichotomocladium elegans]
MRFSITLSLALIATVASVLALPRVDVSSPPNGRVEKRFGRLHHGDRPHGECFDCEDREGDFEDRIEDGRGRHRITGVLGDGPDEELGDGPDEELGDGPSGDLRGNLGDGLRDGLDDTLLSSKPTKDAKDKAASV